MKATFGDWVSYYLENTLTASPYMQLVFLGVIVGIIIVVFGFIYNGGALAPSVASLSGDCSLTTEAAERAELGRTS